MPAPTEEKVLQAMRTVQRLNGKDLDLQITDQVGNPMLGAFKALATALVGNQDNARLNQTVHLMVLAYLMNEEVRK